MPTENTGNADFLRDVATHELTIIRNDGRSLVWGIEKYDALLAGIDSEGGSHD